MPTLGMRKTNQGQADERAYHFRLGIHNLYPTGAPFLHVVTRASNQVLSDAEWRDFEKKFPSQVLQINNGAGYTSGATQLTVNSGDAYKVRKDITVRCPRTMESMLVTADPTATDTINVSRSLGTTAAAALVDDDYLVVIAPAHAEGDPVPSALWYDPAVIQGAAQIMRWPTDQTETARRTKYRTGDLVKEQRREALLLHEIARERAAIFSELSVTASGDKVRRTMKGLIEAITTNVTDFTGSVTRTAINSALADVFEDGNSDERMGLAGKGTLLTLWNMAEAMAWNVYDRQEASFGMKLNEIVTPFGSLMVTHDKLLTKTTGFSDWLICVAPENIEYRFVKGRDTNLLRNRHNPGDDRVIDEWLAEAGISVLHEETHAVMKNMTAFVG